MRDDFTRQGGDPFGSKGLSEFTVSEKLLKKCAKEAMEKSFMHNLKLRKISCPRKSPRPSFKTKIMVHPLVLKSGSNYEAKHFRLEELGMRHGTVML